MADIEFQGYGPDLGYRANARVGRLFNLIGGVVSLGLIAGLGYWSYELLARDVTGVPVIQAMDGPMRVLPDDPGGERAAHQGLAVNRIAAEGEAAPPADRIVLAPRSGDLADEDLPQAALRLTPAVVSAPPARSPVEEAVLQATSQVMAAEADLSDAGFEVIPASVPGVSRSLRPKARPNSIMAAVARVQPAAAAVTPPAEVVEKDPSAIPTGTWLVQFVAPGTPEEARAHWTGLQTRFAALMDGKARVIEEGANGGDTFYRLRAEGFADLADARRFCAALIAEGAECIPVPVR